MSKYSEPDKYAMSRVDEIKATMDQSVRFMWSVKRHYPEHSDTPTHATSATTRIYTITGDCHNMSIELVEVIQHDFVVETITCIKDTEELRKFSSQCEDRYSVDYPQ